MRTIFYFLFGFIFTSCSFNKVFLVPDKLDITHEAFKTVYNKNADTLVIADATCCQPYFKDKENQPLDYPFTIKSIFFDSKSGNKLNAWIISNDSVYNGRNIIFFHGNAGSLVSQHKMM